MQNQRVSKKTFCDVCRRAGKSEKEYTSHYTKSKPGEGGVVTCPTILNSICSYCREKGHFKSACPKLELKMKLDSAEAKKVWRGVGGGARGGAGGGFGGTSKGASAPIVANRYSGLLDMSDDSDAEDGVGVGVGVGVGDGVGGGVGAGREIPKPELVRGVVQPWDVLQDGHYCSVVPMPNNIMAIIEEADAEAEREGEGEVEYKVVPRRRWADYIDSDDEEDEDVDVSFVC
jgi:hypothetical protein